IPPRPIRELRELTRYRKTLVRERAQEVNRVHKVLESANIKLATVASDVVGASARRIGALAMRGSSSRHNRPTSCVLSTALPPCHRFLRLGTRVPLRVL